MSAAPLEAVLFDLDGTLIDSIGLILSSYEHTLRVHGIEPLPREAWIAGLGTPLFVQFRRFTDDEARIDALVATYREHNLAHHDASVRAYEGAVEAVEGLARSGLRLGVVTSKRRAAALRGLEVCGFASLFETLVGVDDCARHKPDPEPVRLALERLGVAAGSAAFVGDSPHDLAAGRAAGVRTGACAWGPFERAELQRERPDAWFETPRDLAALQRWRT